jgi:hypothetical protein
MEQGTKVDRDDQPEVVVPLLTMAFLAQSARWPEITFERLLLWSGVLVAYTGVLWRVWK